MEMFIFRCKESTADELHLSRMDVTQSMLGAHFGLVNGSIVLVNSDEQDLVFAQGAAGMFELAVRIHNSTCKCGRF